LCPWTAIEVPLLMLRLHVNFVYLTGFIIGLLGLAATLVFPRPFCGWVCPLGTMFDFIGEIGRVTKIAAKPIPHWLNEKLRVFAYGVAIILILMTLVQGSLACISACPAFWICSKFSAGIPIITILFLFIILILSLRVKRGFCRFVCPYGALTGLLMPLTRYKIQGNLEVCINCRLCYRACPMGIDFLAEFEIKSPHCISCGECKMACPKCGLDWDKFGRK